MRNKGLSLFCLIIFSLYVAGCNKIDSYDRKGQLIYLFDQNDINYSNFSGFIFILKSFGCSNCEKITYSLISRMINGAYYTDKDFVFISTNSKSQIIYRIEENENLKEIECIILDDLAISRMGLVYPYDMIIELKDGKIIYYNMIEDVTIKYINSRYP